MTLGQKERFLKVYSNIPLGVRREIVMLLNDGRPVSWDVAYIEVSSNTPLSRHILEELERLDII